MRYLLQKDFSNELSSRKAYINCTLSIWAIPFDNMDNFISFVSIPPQAYDTLFVVGHNASVYEYLKGTHIPERYIVAITCQGHYDFAGLNLSGKSLYIAHQSSEDVAELFMGDEYGFSFDITESELLLHNSRHITDWDKRLGFCFTKLF